MPLLLTELDPPLDAYLGLSAVIMSAFAYRQLDLVDQMSNFTSGVEELAVLGRSTMRKLNLGEDLEFLGGLLEQPSLVLTNSICCVIIVTYKIIQYITVGTLRYSENLHMREAFWDHLFRKSMFVLLALEAKTTAECAPWAIWFTALGSIILLTILCKDRFEYLSTSPAAKPWPLIKISILLAFIFITTLTCTTVVFANHFSNFSLFLLADACYVLTFVMSVIIRCLVLTYDMRTNSIWENRTAIIYYSELFCGISLASIELLHHLHLLIIGFSSFFKKFCSLWCLIKMHTLVSEMRKRYKRHKNYLLIEYLLEYNFMMATKEEIEDNSDNCAICWDEMETARKLPCNHLFHNSCLRSWLEQDTSCPTCRTSLKCGQQPVDLTDEIDESSDSEEEFTEAVRPHHQRNRFFHFDSSRYNNHPFLRWLPHISIEGFV